MVMRSGPGDGFAGLNGVLFDCDDCQMDRKRLRDNALAVIAVGGIGRARYLTRIRNYLYNL